ncbi:MAG: hypothetical protein H0U52_09590 [Chloroflexi bacterium]|nr:hypothetical protein [Chloroflexota bacterium]
MSNLMSATGQAGPPGATRSRTRSLPRSTPLGLLSLVLFVLFAACTGAAAPSGVATLVDPSAAPSASPAASLDPEAAMEAFNDCMREHGVDVQIGRVTDEVGGGPVRGTSKGDSGPAGEVDKEDFLAADQACRPLLPHGGVNGPGGEVDPEFQEKFLEFAKCMREHGIDMPDPQFGSGGNSVIIGGPDDEAEGGPGFDPESQEFQDAEKACGDKLPGKLGGASGAQPGTVVKP